MLICKSKCAKRVNVSVNGRLSLSDTWRPVQCTLPFALWQLGKASTPHPTFNWIAGSTDLNFISWQKDRSSRLSIITSTSWHSLVLIWIAWTTLPRIRTYLRDRAQFCTAQSIFTNNDFHYSFETFQRQKTNLSHWHYSLFKHIWISKHLILFKTAPIDKVDILWWKNLKG